MSLTILLIALAHGVPIFLAGAYWNTKLSVTLVALVMCGVAVATGGSQYAIFDLLAIGIVYFLCIRVVGPPPSIKLELPSKQPETKPDLPKNEDSWVGGVVGLIVIGAFIYNIFSDKPPPSPPPVVQAPQQVKVTPAPQKTAVSEQQHVVSKKANTGNVSRSNSDRRHCLELKTNAAIMQCANNGK